MEDHYAVEVVVFVRKSTERSDLALAPNYSINLALPRKYTTTTKYYTKTWEYYEYSEN